MQTVKLRKLWNMLTIKPYICQQQIFLSMLVYSEGNNQVLDQLMSFGHCCIQADHIPSPGITRTLYTVFINIRRRHHFFIGTIVVTQCPPMFRLSKTTTGREIRQCFDQTVTRIFARSLWLIKVSDQGPIGHFVMTILSGPEDPIRRVALLPFSAFGPNYRLKSDLSHVIFFFPGSKLPLNDLQWSTIKKIDVAGPLNR